MKRFSFTVKLSALLLLPIFFLSGPVAVLCLGHDGHVAIESGWDGDCEGEVTCCHEADGDANAVPEPDHTHPVDSDCCGDCVDIALQLDAARLSSSEKEVSTDASSSFTPYLHLLLPQATAEAVFRPPPIDSLLPSSPLCAWRTVLLLI